MTTIIILIGTILFCSCGGLEPEPDPQEPGYLTDPCCKHCTNSQPCGDSCISKGKKCKKPIGCACQ